MEPISVVAISGSLRSASYNRRLLVEFAEMAPPQMHVDLFPLDGVPVYNGDIEDAGDPPEVANLKDSIRSADALLFATPEYNGGIAGSLKNAIDWASRGDNPISGKPCAIVGGGGRLATAHSQLMLRHVLSYLGCPVLPRPTLYVSRLSAAFENDRLVDEAAIRKLRELGPALVDWVNRLR